MIKSQIFNISFCELLIYLAIATIFFFFFLSNHNVIMSQRRQIPPLAKEKESLQEEIIALEVLWDEHHAPASLLKDACMPSMGHLKPCCSDDITNAAG